MVLLPDFAELVSAHTRTSAPKSLLRIMNNQYDAETEDESDPTGFVCLDESRVDVAMDGKRRDCFDFARVLVVIDQV